MYDELLYELEDLLIGMDDEMLLGFVGIIGGIVLIVALIALVGHIFQSIGLYTIAKRRGIANPWLSWIPVGNYWIAGSIADDYQEKICGEMKMKRYILLGISVVSMLLSGMSTGEDSAGFIGVLQSAVSFATLIFWNWALFDLYSSCRPKNNVVFLILGVIFGFAVPYFIFASRKYDEGMPQPQPAAEYAYQTNPQPREYKEPWEI